MPRSHPPLRSQVSSLSPSKLTPTDWGQIIDCLHLRMIQYQETADYFTHGVSWGNIIEEVRDAAEANAMVTTYQRLIAKLEQQR
jgi:hypothetical protein